MKNLVKKVVNKAVKAKNRYLWEIRKHYPKYEVSIVREYIINHKVRKLQIGCGNSIKTGWLNTNFEKWRKEVICLDASKKFPIEDKVFDYI